MEVVVKGTPTIVGKTSKGNVQVSVIVGGNTIVNLYEDKNNKGNLKPLLDNLHKELIMSINIYSQNSFDLTYGAGFKNLV